MARTPKAADEKPVKDKTAKAKPQAANPADGDEAPAAEAVGGVLKLKELIDTVAAKTSGKKPEVKAVVEATLAALGEALATGKALAVPPLGKVRVVKNKGPALTLKLRPADSAKAAGLALADDGEDG